MPKGLREPQTKESARPPSERSVRGRWKGRDFQEEQTAWEKTQKHETAGPTQRSTGS